MKFTKAGIIVFTENYERCVEFYGSVLDLPLMHEINRTGERLTTFALGDNYLMIESGGVASGSGKKAAQNPTKLRFNVADVDATAEALAAKGIDIAVTTHSWGTTAEFSDPDGNRCALRSDVGFGD